MLLSWKSSIFIFFEFGKVILESEIIFAELEKILFPISLIDATIQDGGTRARKNDMILLQELYYIKSITYYCRIF